MTDPVHLLGLRGAAQHNRHSRSHLPTLMNMKVKQVLLDLPSPSVQSRKRLGRQERGQLVGGGWFQAGSVTVHCGYPCRLETAPHWLLPPSALTRAPPKNPSRFLIPCRHSFFFLSRVFFCSGHSPLQPYLSPLSIFVQCKHWRWHCTCTSRLNPPSCFLPATALSQPSALQLYSELSTTQSTAIHTATTYTRQRNHHIIKATTSSKQIVPFPPRHIPSLSLI